MADRLAEQAERLYSVFAELVRRYQFRDRDQICCYGLSVSQCYTLEALAAGESLTMSDLALRLCLKISSMTRVVDHLVAEGLVRRVEDRSDRRVCRVQLAAKGRALFHKVQSGLLKEYEQVLAKVPADSREAVIEAMAHLLAAFQSRSCCSEDSEQIVPLNLGVKLMTKVRTSVVLVALAFPLFVAHRGLAAPAVPPCCEGIASPGDCAGKCCSTGSPSKAPAAVTKLDGRGKPAAHCDWIGRDAALCVQQALTLPAVATGCAIPCTVVKVVANLITGLLARTDCCSPHAAASGAAGKASASKRCAY